MRRGRGRGRRRGRRGLPSFGMQYYNTPLSLTSSDSGPVQDNITFANLGIPTTRPSKIINVRIRMVMELTASPVYLRARLALEGAISSPTVMAGAFRQPVIHLRNRPSSDYILPLANDTAVIITASQSPTPIQVQGLVEVWASVGPEV